MTLFDSVSKMALNRESNSIFGGYNNSALPCPILPKDVKSSNPMFELHRRNAKRVSADFNPNGLLRCGIDEEYRRQIIRIMVLAQMYTDLPHGVLHRAMAIFDRYLWLDIPSHKEILGLAAASFRIAANTYQISGLDTDFFRNIRVAELDESTLRGYEMRLILALEYELFPSTPTEFFDHIIHSCHTIPSDLRPIVYQMCYFLSDLGLTNFITSYYPVDTRCAAVIYLIRLLLSKHWYSLTARELDVSTNSIMSLRDLAPWSPILTTLTGRSPNMEMYRLVEVYGLAIEDYQKFMNSGGSKEPHLAPIVGKYSLQQYHRVASMRLWSCVSRETYGISAKV